MSVLEASSRPITAVAWASNTSNCPSQFSLVTMTTARTCTLSVQYSHVCHLTGVVCWFMCLCRSIKLKMEVQQTSAEVLDSSQDITCVTAGWAAQTHTTVSHSHLSVCLTLTCDSLSALCRTFTFVSFSPVCLTLICIRHLFHVSVCVSHLCLFVFHVSFTMLHLSVCLYVWFTPTYLPFTLWWCLSHSHLSVSQRICLEGWLWQMCRWFQIKRRFLMVIATSQNIWSTVSQIRQIRSVRVFTRADV